MCNRCDILKDREPITADEVTEILDTIIADDGACVFDSELVLRMIAHIEEQSRYIVEVVAARGVPDSRLN